MCTPQCTWGGQSWGSSYTLHVFRELNSSHQACEASTFSLWAISLVPTRSLITEIANSVETTAPSGVSSNGWWWFCGTHQTQAHLTARGSSWETEVAEQLTAASDNTSVWCAAPLHVFTSLKTVFLCSSDIFCPLKNKLCYFMAINDEILLSANYLIYDILYLPLK